MDTRKFRDLAVLLPGEEPEGLDPVGGVPKDKATITDRLIDSDAWVRAKFTGCTVTRCWTVNADLASIDLNETTFDRCIFRGSSFIGAHLTDITLKNVIFENCRFDYATLTLVRAVGPVAFVGCSLTETVLDRCKLGTSVFDDCKLNAPDFKACDLRGADFRGNVLSRTIGVTQSFKGVILSEVQMVGFTEAVTRELELTIKSEPIDNASQGYARRQGS